MTAVAKIFENGGDFESSEEAATAAIEALDKARRDRLTYGVAVQGLPVATVYVGFENREEAVRWCKRTGLDVAGLPVGIVPLWDKDHVLDRHVKQDSELAGQPAAPKPKRSPRKKAA